ncbi:hypothetical protein MNEG_8074 [Monoraphidium neglectum]|uniref:TRAF-type domain-containing protein n=1 Tax=Monoraphidium neglectum TaxID=145388 RepID=A0A0D2M9A3_9CHLO|nr:hypothetical protein MNEG_8074 [Monoraphidium neglectum]KIY99889.1 hypothetical protein MNEG_8074 [Monoraphidium neglectum]|eukprot:XP_013898909.1 hypothetical protein MNEG_8074 [Monoraphidium neglectum]
MQACSCPYCRRPLRYSQLRHDAVLQAQLDALQVRCPNAPAGCGALMARGRVAEHLRVECPSQPAACEHCGLVALRRELAGHAAECPDRPVPCANAAAGCGALVPASAMDLHLAASCEWQPAACSGYAAAAGGANATAAGAGATEYGTLPDDDGGCLPAAELRLAEGGYASLFEALTDDPAAAASAPAAAAAEAGGEEAAQGAEGSDWEDGIELGLPGCSGRLGVAGLVADEAADAAWRTVLNLGLVEAMSSGDSLGAGLPARSIYMGLLRAWAAVARYMDDIQDRWWEGRDARAGPEQQQQQQQQQPVSPSAGDASRRQHRHHGIAVGAGRGHAQHAHGHSSRTAAAVAAAYAAVQQQPRPQRRRFPLAVSGPAGGASQGLDQDEREELWDDIGQLGVHEALASIGARASCALWGRAAGGRGGERVGALADLSVACVVRDIEMAREEEREDAAAAARRGHRRRGGDGRAGGGDGAAASDEVAAIARVVEGFRGLPAAPGMHALAWGPALGSGGGGADGGDGTAAAARALARLRKRIPAPGGRGAAPLAVTAEFLSARLLLDHFMAERIETTGIPTTNAHITHGWRAYWAPSLLRLAASRAPSAALTWRALSAANDMASRLAGRVLSLMSSTMFDAGANAVEVSGDSVLAALRLALPAPLFDAAAPRARAAMARFRDVECDDISSVTWARLAQQLGLTFETLVSLLALV